MVIELLSYKESFLNPLFKIVIFILFLISVYYFYRCHLRYGGKLQIIANLLMLGGVAGCMAWLFRYEGDFYSQWKWGESILTLILAIISLVIAYIVRLKFKHATVLFGFEQQKDQN